MLSAERFVCHNSLLNDVTLFSGSCMFMMSPLLTNGIIGNVIIVQFVSQYFVDLPGYEALRNSR